MNKVVSLLATAALAAGLAAVRAQGVTANEIKIGTWGPQSGPAQAWGNTMVGMEAYFKLVNAAGGVNGRQLTLTKRNDEYQPARTQAVVKELIEREKVFALVGGVGTPNGVAILDDVRRARIPWVGPLTGSVVFAEPIKREVFALYTNYVTESALMTRHAVNTLKKTKFAVFHLNNAYGLEGVRGVTEELARAAYRGKASLVASVPHEQTETSLAVQALRLKESGADAVVLYTQDTAAIALLREFTRIGYAPQLLLSSTLLSPSMFQAGPAFNGAIVASFLPVPGLDPKADRFLASLARYADPPEAVRTDPFRVLAGAAFAEVLVEGLKRAGPSLDRNKFIAAMERLRDWKDGQFNRINFSAGDRQGNNSVFLVRARFQPTPGFDRASDWVEF